MGVDSSSLYQMEIRLSLRRHIHEYRSKLGKLLYRKILQIGLDQWLYMNVVLHEWGEDSLLQMERIILKTKMRDLLPEDKHLFCHRWRDLWGLPGKDKKIWSIELTEAIKYSKHIRDRETTGR